MGMKRLFCFFLLVFGLFVWFACLFVCLFVCLLACLLACLFFFVCLLVWLVLGETIPFLFKCSALQYPLLQVFYGPTQRGFTSDADGKSDPNRCSQMVPSGKLT